MVRLAPNLKQILVAIIMITHLTIVDAQKYNGITPIQTASLSLISPFISHKTPSLIPKKYPPRLSASTLYRMAIKSARQKRYAIALNILNRVSHLKKRDARNPDDTHYFREPLHGPNYVDLSQFNHMPVFRNTEIPEMNAPLTTPEEIPLTDFSLMNLNVDSLVIYATQSDTIQTTVPESKPIKIKTIIRAFNDHKPAKAYGLFLHIKQPIPGKRKTFKWFGTVGHSFITLIKFNQDGTHVSRTYGFYPKKHFLLQATPLLPWAPSDYKNDSLHNWDESLAQLITEKQFHKIIRVTRRFARKSYHLSKTNCTDFALDIANIAGIHIDQTKGHWPMGGGNDPGDTGQSILEKKFRSGSSTIYFIFSPQLRSQLSLNSSTNNASN